MALQAVTSVLTVVIALFALFSWRKQEQLKTKLAFKNAIADYANQLKKIASHHQRSTVEQNTKLEELFNACHHALLVTEGLLNDNKEVMEAWAVINNQVTQYMVSGGDPESIEKMNNACDKILKEKFVFNKSIFSLCK
ncbi:hypothetical protein [Trabulsiella odontotermitis]|uniref:Uncharacterized protein n=1 Tax=Trabulsiella odontotermitis TaxID=379893 RepID=A0A0L0GHI6_9ENTR|nr:hypothetical protein [Trabulsiella odontotermitis]KNC88281.1 hypothetical protein GM31_11205 [Trabulsiella odontotermitis]